MKKSSSPRKKKQLKLPHVDILILHGKSLELVNFFIEFFESINIRAKNVSNLPSGRMNLERKVEFYLKNCGLPLILVTFDEDEPASNKARANVYDEIARCRSLRRKDALILQERRDLTLVQLPSNVVGQLVVIQFDGDRVHLALPQLLKEIHSRGLISTTRSPETTLDAGSILNDFMDKMDELWDQQFDKAWKKIHRRDYFAERKLADDLDKFFQQYHSVIDVLVRKRKRGDELKVICDTAYEEAVACATRAWEYVAEAMFRKVDEIIDKKRLSKAVIKSQELYENASDQLRIATRGTDQIEKMKSFKFAIELVDKCLKQLRK